MTLCWQNLVVSQQILCYHHGTVPLDNTCVVKLAMVSGCIEFLGADRSDTVSTNKSWQCHQVIGFSLARRLQ